ncbi:hypothetical protein GCM10028777_18230 [Angustibacter speluncae]
MTGLGSYEGTPDTALATYDQGEFAIDGATWHPIQEEAQVDSAGGGAGAGRQ